MRCHAVMSQAGERRPRTGGELMDLAKKRGPPGYQIRVGPFTGSGWLLVTLVLGLVELALRGRNHAVFEEPAAETRAQAT